MAVYQIPVLQSFTFKSEQWESWLRRFERFCEASGLSGKSEETQISTLIYSMGDRSEDILKSFALSEEDAKKYLMVIGKFNNHFGKSYMTEPSGTRPDRGWNPRRQAVPEAPDGC